MPARSMPASRMLAQARCGRRLSQCSKARRRLGAMELPPGPRAPAAWQTVGWIVRPAGFLERVHRRFGDPVTIRTYWTDEPMVLFSHPDAVRDVFRLDPAVAPAGQSCEFLRP